MLSNTLKFVERLEIRPFNCKDNSVPKEFSITFEQIDEVTGKFFSNGQKAMIFSLLNGFLDLSALGLVENVTELIDRTSEDDMRMSVIRTILSAFRFITEGSIGTGCDTATIEGHEVCYISSLNMAIPTTYIRRRRAMDARLHDRSATSRCLHLIVPLPNVDRRKKFEICIATIKQ